MEADDGRHASTSTLSETCSSTVMFAKTTNLLTSHVLNRRLAYQVGNSSLLCIAIYDMAMLNTAETMSHGPVDEVWNAACVAAAFWNTSRFQRCGSCSVDLLPSFRSMKECDGEAWWARQGFSRMSAQVLQVLSKAVRSKGYRRGRAGGCLESSAWTNDLRQPSESWLSQPILATLESALGLVWGG